MRLMLTAMAVLWMSTSAAVTVSANDGGASLHVTGYGAVSVTPDTALFRFEVAQQDQNATTAQADVETRTAQLIDAIKALPLNTDSLQAAGLSVTPQYRWTPDRSERRFDGFRVSRKVSFVLTDLGRLGDAYQTLISNGATSVDPAQLLSSSEASAADRALELAYQNAEHQARLLASAADMELGLPLRIDTAATANPTRPVMRMAADTMEAASAVYEPGQLEVGRRINVEFQLLEPR
jgi:uncharacterized protein YggE